MAKRCKTCDVVNFPIDFIPLIIEDREVLRRQCLRYAFAYFLNSRGKNVFKKADLKWTADLFCVSVGDATTFLRDMNFLWQQYGKRKPLTRVLRGELWHYVNDYISDAELAALVFLLAMRSIGRVGIETRSTLDLLCARMRGEIKPETEPVKKKRKTSTSDEVAHFIEHWMRNPRNRRKIQRMLEETGNIEFPKGHSRGIKWTEKKRKQEQQAI